MNLYTYEVGQKILPATGEDSVRFQTSDSGCSLLIQYNRPSAAEKRQFRQPAQFEIAVVDGIIFFLCRFGTADWMDAPFDRSRAAGVTIEKIPEGQEGLALHFMLVDSSTGTLLHQRLIGLDTTLSRRLIAAIAYQPELPDFDQRLAKIYASYSTRDLLSIAREQEKQFSNN